MVGFSFIVGIFIDLKQAFKVVSPFRVMPRFLLIYRSLTHLFEAWLALIFTETIVIVLEISFGQVEYPESICFEQSVFGFVTFIRGRIVSGSHGSLHKFVGGVEFKMIRAKDHVILF